MSQAKTIRNTFCAEYGPNDPPMFAVNEGVPVSAALESASCLLSVAKGLLFAPEGKSLDVCTTEAALVIVSQAKALLDAAWEGLDDAQITEKLLRSAKGGAQ